jgi:Transposase DNA-binding
MEQGGMMPEIPDDEPWVVTEFVDAELGNARRTQRLEELATVLTQQPSTSLPKAWGIPAMLKAAYRVFDNAAIDPPKILASHVVATSNRLAGVPWVLAVQDTTELDRTAHLATRGLGPLVHPAHQGLLVHMTLALTPECLPLGLLAQQVWARDPAVLSKRATRKRRPLAEKESQQWLTSVDAVIEPRRAVRRRTLSASGIVRPTFMTCLCRCGPRAWTC